MINTIVPISIIQTAVSRLSEMNLYNLPFGKHFSDHMLEADYIDGKWINIQIRPYQPVCFNPALHALHYGQAIFEGIKAYANANGKASIFRLQESYNRFNQSALRLQMPPIEKQIFIEGIRQLVSLDNSWIPQYEDHSLYIRPFMFSTDDCLGVKPSENYKFMTILSPSGPYYSTPLKILVEEHYVRASPGGVGQAKVAGNYGSSMLAASRAKAEGYDQVLWMDAFEHKYVQEMGLMNFFFIRKGIAITPNLDEGTILKGITRDSCLTLLREMGYRIEERPLSIDEIAEAYNKKDDIELFGTGTAATISPIGTLRYRDLTMQFNVDQWRVAPDLKKSLMDIRKGITEDRHNWLTNV